MGYEKTLTCLDTLDKNKPIFFDTETLGLFGRTRLVQLRQDDKAYEIDCFYINIEDLKYWLKPCHLIGHNIHYDLSCLDFRRWVPRKIDDTKLLASFMWPTLESYSLASLCDFLKLETKGKEGESDWGQYCLTQNQLDYASKDTLFVKQIYEKIDKEIFESDYYKLDIKSIEFALLYQNKGMVLNKKQLQKVKREIENKIKNSPLPKELNVSSPKQVCEFLNVAKSNIDILINLNDTKAKLVLDKRRYEKSLSYFESLMPHNFIYSFTSPGGAKTGRFTCKGGYTKKDEDYFNLQQIPREFKSIFGVSNGAFYVTADYPALEIWVCAALIADEFMVKTLKNKEDLHYNFAEKLFNKPKEFISKLERTIAKTCNFTLLYGAGYNALKRALCQVEMFDIAKKSQELRCLWLNTYKQIASHIQNAYDYFNVNSYKIVRTALGRPMYATKSTESLNYEVQGTGAECTKLALYYLQKEGIIPVSTVHDSIALIASNEKEANEYAQALSYCMEEAFSKVIRNCKANDLRLKVEPYIGENYD